MFWSRPPQPRLALPTAAGSRSKIEIPPSVLPSSCDTSSRQSNERVEMSAVHTTRPGTITVTVRTPAGTPQPFEVRTNERVDKLVRNAVRYFVQAGQLAAGEYGLALIRDGRAEDLADAARLDDYGVVEGDVVVLIAKAPQVDG
jgi:hypothetical protein